MGLGFERARTHASFGLEAKACANSARLSNSVSRRRRARVGGQFNSGLFNHAAYAGVPDASRSRMTSEGRSSFFKARPDPAIRRATVSMRLA